jgi:hypothetical protein
VREGMRSVLCVYLSSMSFLRTLKPILEALPEVATADRMVSE